MAHEYVAIFLERVECTNFPTLKALLDKYKFMFLEAEGKLTVEDREAEKIDTKFGTTTLIISKPS
ncbi:hypothetical protein DPMN_093816 [Dreissena polymorpha]|uniref:Uncharacterized protein n=1 Tax=Dreissena polymorpha TaxID=45954 RepID=A0A9D4L6G3_DREPO|nr:hypothetical protein DPMN_093816 [Dreissena polymorpha]